MKVVVAGAHGQVAMQLHPLLRGSGIQVRGIIRNPNHAGEVAQAGAEPIVFDMETDSDFSGAIGDADTIVFAAGGGGPSPAARKWAVDRDAAIKLMKAGEKANVQRFVMLSAISSGKPFPDDEMMNVYAAAKGEADQALRQSRLPYTIVRPGPFTNEAATGLVDVAPQLPRRSIPRADVALVLYNVIIAPGGQRVEFDLTSGSIPIETAIRNILM